MVLVSLLGCSKINLNVAKTFFSAPTGPRISNITIPASANYLETDVLEFTVSFSEIVNVTGTPVLAITIGGTTTSATYISGSGTRDLVFQ